jgi:hypothetical protein
VEAGEPSVGDGPSASAGTPSTKGARQPPSSSPPASPATQEPENEVLVARLVDPFHPEADVLCVAGGGIQVPRENGRIAPGTKTLRVDVEIDQPSVFTGVRVGYAVDSNAAPHAAESDVPVTWLAPVFLGERSLAVEVDEELTEGTGHALRWVFYYELNPGVDAACYTGVGLGALSVAVSALRTGSAS